MIQSQLTPRRKDAKQDRPRMRTAPVRIREPRGLGGWNGRISELLAWYFLLGWKAVEDDRSPRRFAMGRTWGIRQVLECASPLALGWSSIGTFLKRRLAPAGSRTAVFPCLRQLGDAPSAPN
jgi:hypothetical protein